LSERKRERERNRKLGKTRKDRGRASDERALRQVGPAARATCAGATVPGARRTLSELRSLNPS
jgi:hypothetical protein